MSLQEQSSHESSALGGRGATSLNNVVHFELRDLQASMDGTMQPNIAERAAPPPAEEDLLDWFFDTNGDSALDEDVLAPLFGHDDNASTGFSQSSAQTRAHRSPSTYQNAYLASPSATGRPGEQQQCSMAPSSSRHVHTGTLDSACRCCRYRSGLRIMFISIACTKATVCL
jgi:hypothetical protein